MALDSINFSNYNFFQQPVNQIGGINGKQSTGIESQKYTAGGTQFTSGGSAVDRELADVRRFIPSYNGTGELRPNNAEANAKFSMLYA